MADQTEKFRYSYAVQIKDSMDVAFGGAFDFTWNGFWRLAYDKANQGIQKQANQLVKTGNFDAEEARQLVEVQRNGLVLTLRNELTPFGQFYSEVLKPGSSLKTLEQYVAEKGTVEAVLRSVGKSRQSVNRIAFVARRAGSAWIVIDIIMTIVVVEEAPLAEREKVAAEQVGGVAGSVVGARFGGLGGAWVGVTTFTALGSPSLAIPGVGEITEGVVALAGGVVGFLAGGLLGWEGGQVGGEKLWQFTQVTWRYS